MAEKNDKPRAASKTAMYQELADKTGLSRKQVSSVFEGLGDYIKVQLSKKGPGVFVLPGLLKIMRVEKPATKARQGKNPRTGEPITIKAKPKRIIVKPRALKALKEMVK